MCISIISFLAELKGNAVNNFISNKSHIEMPPSIKAVKLEICLFFCYLKVFIVSLLKISKLSCKKR